MLPPAAPVNLGMSWQEHQQLLRQKEGPPDILCGRAKAHKPTEELAKGTETRSDAASGSSCPPPQRTKDRGAHWRYLQIKSAKSRPGNSTSQMAFLQQIACKEKKGSGVTINLISSSTHNPRLLGWPLSWHVRVLPWLPVVGWIVSPKKTGSRFKPQDLGMWPYLETSSLKMQSH